MSRIGSSSYPGSDSTANLFAQCETLLDLNFSMMRVKMVSSSEQWKVRTIEYWSGNVCKLWDWDGGVSSTIDRSLDSFCVTSPKFISREAGDLDNNGWVSLATSTCEPLNIHVDVDVDGDDDDDGWEEWWSSVMVGIWPLLYLQPSCAPKTSIYPEVRHKRAS